MPDFDDWNFGQVADNALDKVSDVELKIIAETIGRDLKVGAKLNDCLTEVQYKLGLSHEETEKLSHYVQAASEVDGGKYCDSQKDVSKPWKVSDEKLDKTERESHPKGSSQGWDFPMKGNSKDKQGRPTEHIEDAADADQHSMQQDFSDSPKNADKSWSVSEPSADKNSLDSNPKDVDHHNKAWDVPWKGPSSDKSGHPIPHINDPLDAKAHRHVYKCSECGEEI